MSTPRTRKRRERTGWHGASPRPNLDRHTRLPQEVQTRPPMLSPGPVTPEEWPFPDHERMEEDADLARFARFVTLPLTRLSQRTGTATAHAGPIHHAQTPIGFSALLLDTKLLVCGTAQCAVWLEREIVARKAHGMRNELALCSIYMNFMSV